ncbi:MAG: hypothetical protein KAG70_08535, partial [Alcanivorax sp.]|nr:hypothetical protein [Alcanivorax sp.]
MNTSLAQRQQVLIEQIESEETALADLQIRLRTVESELTDMAPQRQKFQLLGVICESLDQLSEMGAASLFWGDDASPSDHEKQLSRSRELASAFNNEFDNLEAGKTEIQQQISQGEERLGELDYHLAEVTEELENAQYDFVIEREADDEKLFRAGIMPWSRSDEDRKRQRKVLLCSL